MQYTKIEPKIQKALYCLLERYPAVMPIAQVLSQAGARVFLVGGAVRDLLLGLVDEIKDLDIEVHGKPLLELEEILRRFGTVNMQGKSYGVLRVGSLDADWSVPRIDQSGRKPTVTIDPLLDIRRAFERRDLTINAMGIDLVTHELLDPFGGQEDLKNKRLVAPNIRLFIEDPLRFFRVMQFVARFQATPNQELTDTCRSMDIRTVSRERITEEFYKVILKAHEPSRAFRWLQEIGRLKDILPELHALVGVVQPEKWHPEGDVFEHSMQALDAAMAPYVVGDKAQSSQYNRVLIAYAALCHDLGKATTTRVNTLPDGQVKVTAYGHDVEGVALATALLKRIEINQKLIITVGKLVRYHLCPPEFIKQGAKSAAYRRLACNLAPETSCFVLALLSKADVRGRSPHGNKPLAGPVEIVDQFIQKAQELGVLHGAPAPILQGRDLIDCINKGPLMGILLKRAFDIQINEGVNDKQELRARVLALKKHNL